MEAVKNPQSLVSVACEWLLRLKKHYRERRAGRIKLIKNIKTKFSADYCVFLKLFDSFQNIFDIEIVKIQPFY